MNEHYEVCKIASGVIVYKGKSEASAARKLLHGTCYGKGQTPLMAGVRAASEVRRFQKR